MDFVFVNVSDCFNSPSLDAVAIFPYTSNRNKDKKKGGVFVWFKFEFLC